MKPVILFVDDEPMILNALEKLFSAEYEVLLAESGEEALEKLTTTEVEVVVVDQKMPGMDGVETLRAIRQAHPLTVRVALTAHADVQTLVESVNYGQIFRYVSKPWGDDELNRTLKEGVAKYRADRAALSRQEELQRLANEKARLEQEVVFLKSEIEREFSLDNIVSVSPEMGRVRRMIRASALNDETVLIQGESGTGKELVARAIHYNSKRHAAKFIAVDCGALSETLLEGELFGYRRGAFTGAVRDQKGLFEEADGGTVFLDEISNTSLKLQSRLLRVIQEKEIRRIGEMQPRFVDVRILAATNQDLRSIVLEKLFREDLYYRLNVIPIQMPALRDRPSDIPILVNHFINQHNLQSAKKIRSISREALHVLCKRTWPGNVRELRNAVNRMLAFANSDHLDVNEIPEEEHSIMERHGVNDAGMSADFHLQEIVPMDDVERRYIQHVLGHTAGNKTEAAKLMGVKRTTLLMRMKKLGLN